MDKRYIEIELETALDIATFDETKPYMVYYMLSDEMAEYVNNNLPELYVYGEAIDYEIKGNQISWEV
jgi:hypothetical protein